MKRLVMAGICLATATIQANAQVNAGALAPEASLPFTMTQVATFNLPWRIAFLPDGRMLITEKVGLVAGHPAGRQDAGRQYSGSALGGTGRHAGRLPLAPLCRATHCLSHLFGAGRGGSSLALARAQS